MISSGEFHKVFKEEIIPILFKVFQKLEKETPPTYFMGST